MIGNITLEFSKSNYIISKNKKILIGYGEKDDT